MIYADPTTFLNPEYTIAVVEASNNKASLGFSVYAALQQAKVKRVAVNPQETRVQADPCFPSIAQARPFPDVIVLTMFAAEYPEFGINLLKEMRDTGVFRLWVEPGCESAGMKEFAEENKISMMTNFSLRNYLPI